MNADDLARLSIAKRAYRAAQPSEREVQTGVRRARLSLERRKPRRNWFSKGLVMVVLAAGGLAYAKPQALSEVVAQVTAASAPVRREVTATGPTRTEVEVSRESASRANEQRLAPRRSDAVESPAARAPLPIETGQAPMPASTHRVAKEGVKLTASEAARGAVQARGESGGSTESPAAPGGSSEARSGSSEGRAVTADGAVARAAAESLSDWGRVGQALARGDEQQALKALRDLSESGDPRTRDKADLGRAQLLMTHGKTEEACRLARSLSNRRAGGRIERQAQTLLKSCR